MDAIVFLGPTLPLDDAARILPATYLPPAQQGDVYRAVRAHRPAALGLVDGRFLDTGAVWHRELLWALSQGVHVFGAASMGALRAAELHSFGMRGVGQVFAAYRDGVWPGDPDPFEDDDEVAVIHAPAEAGGAPLSDAMVDIRATLDAARDSGLLSSGDARHLTRALKRRPFPDRSFAALHHEARHHLGPAAADRLARSPIRRKQQDAAEMLHAMAALLATRPGPFTPNFTFHQPLAWQRFVAAEADALDERERTALDRLRQDPAAWAACRDAALGRILPAPAEPDPTLALDRLRRRRGLWQRDDLARWMADNALDERTLHDLLQRQAAIEHWADHSPPGLLRAMADHLRLTGAFPALLQAARPC